MKNTKDRSGFGNIAAVVRSCRSRAPQAVALLCAMSLVGCLARSGDASDGDVGVAQEAALTNNALTNNALTSNALTNNALTSNALTNNALTNNALSSNSLVTSALSDPAAREVLEYVASCALPAGDQLDLVIDGVPYTFPGQLGLASAWGQAGGTCTTSCQQWVSACVMSRVDYLGVTVSISMRGKTAALFAPKSEIDAYTSREGAYYGNIFLASPQRFACISPEQTGLTRVCGPSTTGCVVEVVGTCDVVCDHPDKVGYFFPSCRDAARDATGHFPAGTTTYAESVSIFVQP